MAEKKQQKTKDFDFLKEAFLPQINLRLYKVYVYFYQNDLTS